MKQSSEIFFETAQGIRRKINCVFPIVDLPALTPDLIFHSSNYFDLFFIPCETFVTENNFTENEIYQNRLAAAKELAAELNTVLVTISRDENAVENLTSKPKSVSQPAPAKPKRTPEMSAKEWKKVYSKYLRQQTNTNN